jgi:hypothetical protein
MASAMAKIMAIALMACESDRMTAMAAAGSGGIWLKKIIKSNNEEIMKAAKMW